MDELISRRQAIDVIDKEQKEIDVSDVSAMYAYSKCKTIIKQLPSALSTNLAEAGTDCISRQAAIKTVGWYSCHSGDELLFADNALRQLPPIQPKRGRWIKLDMHRGMADHKCTACEQECYVPTCMGEPLYAFCPNCGSYNGGEQDDKCRQV